MTEYAQALRTRLELGLAEAAASHDAVIEAAGRLRKPELVKHTFKALEAFSDGSVPREALQETAEQMAESVIEGRARVRAVERMRNYRARRSSSGQL